MEWLADTHVHVYPAHDPSALFRQGLQRLRQLAQTASPCYALFLTEAAGHDYFEQLLSGEHRLPADWQVTAGAEPHVAEVRPAGGDPLWIFQGRQLVARERVEILALAGNPDSADGQPAAELIEQVHASGAVPVLAWAPGKWLFHRAKVVAALLEQFGPDDLWLGDSALRPLGWPTPSPMRSPQRRVLAGTDPLPFAGDEQQVGGYGIRVEADFDPQQPLTSARNMLRVPVAELTRFGQRNTPLTMLQRMQRHRAQKQVGTP